MSPQPETSAPPADPVFREPWEARVFALAVTLNRAGLFTWAEWNTALVERIRASDCGEASYDVWLDTLEALLIERAATDRGVLDGLREAWRAAAEATPHGQPIALDPAVLRRVASEAAAPA